MGYFFFENENMICIVIAIAVVTMSFITLHREIGDLDLMSS